MSKQRFWPITISGAIAVFLAGAVALKAMELAWQQPEGGMWIYYALLAWLLLHHAAGTARISMPTGTFTLGWWGIRTSTRIVETVVSAPDQSKKSEPAQ